MESDTRTPLPGVETISVQLNETGRKRVQPFGAEFDEELFSEGRQRSRLTHRERREHNARITQQKRQANPLDLSAEELKELQRTDDSLEVVRQPTSGQPNTVAGTGFLVQDGLLLRRWTPAGADDPDMEVEQLVLPRQRRKAVLQLAHQIPLAGHLGRQKTAQRILQQFY